MATPMSGQIIARLRHQAYELHQCQQLIATVSDRVQTVLDDIQVCTDHASLIDPAVDTLNQRIQTLTEDMDRVYALRNDEHDSYLREENSRQKRDIAFLHESIRQAKEQHEAHVNDLSESNKELTQRVEELAKFNDLLRSRTNEMRQEYESAIIDNVDLKNTVKTLQSTPAFNVVANAAATSDANGGASPAPIPFGKTVVETNRGLTVTIESSPSSSPEKASLNRGWIDQDPSAEAFPFPDIVPQHDFTSVTPADGESTQMAMPLLVRSKNRPIVKGTQAANESFERMQRALALSSLSNRADATAITSSPVSEPSIKAFAANSETPRNLKSKLNPTVEAFTPSSSGKDSAKSSTMQVTATTNDDTKSEITTKTSNDENSIPPHLRRYSKVSDKETVTAIDETSSKDKIKDLDTVVINAKKKAANGFGQLPATSMKPRVLPHLRRMTNVIRDENLHPSHSQYSGKGKDKAETNNGKELWSRPAALTSIKENVKAATTPGPFVQRDPGVETSPNSQEPQSTNASTTQEATSTATGTLIDIEPDDSHKAGEEKMVPEPSAFIPMSFREAPVKTETPAPTIILGDRVTDRNSTAERSPAQAFSTSPASEKENNARFLKEYFENLSTVSQRYGKASRQASANQEEGVEASEPIKPTGANPIPQYYLFHKKPTGTRHLGALLDDESRGMVLKPRDAAANLSEQQQLLQQWKAVRKHDGKVVYVL
ncbi:hypothetical protein BDR22DRAFT_890382 [Usnea florida]